MFAEYITLLKTNPNYKYLWLGAVVSQLGDWFNLIASAALVANITDSGTALSYLFLARFLPQFVFSPFAGVFADRYDRRYVMIASDLLRAVTVLSFLLVRRPEHVWLFYFLTTLQFMLSSLFIPARAAALATIVSRKELITAWLIGRISIETASRLERVVTARLRGQGWLEFVEGLRYLKGKSVILGIALVKAGAALVWGAINVLEINFAESIFPLNVFPTVAGDVVTLTVIYTLSGLGTGIGPLVLRRWLGDTPQWLLVGISISFILQVVGIFGLSFAPTLLIFLIWTTIRTIGGGTLWVFSAAILQMTVPDYVRGRVFAFEFAILTLTQSLSIYWAGFAQDTFKLTVRQTTLTLGVLGVIINVIWLAFYMFVRRSQAFEEQLVSS